MTLMQSTLLSYIKLLFLNVILCIVFKQFNNFYNLFYYSAYYRQYFWHYLYTNYTTYLCITSAMNPLSQSTPTTTKPMGTTLSFQQSFTNDIFFLTMTVTFISQLNVILIQQLDISLINIKTIKQSLTITIFIWTPWLILIK